MAILAPSGSPPGPILSFSTQTGMVYHIYYRNSLDPANNWRWLTALPGELTNIIWTDPKPDPILRLYKIVPISQ
jgi:hypothetical protein